MALNRDNEGSILVSLGLNPKAMERAKARTIVSRRSTAVNTVQSGRKPSNLRVGSRIESLALSIGYPRHVEKETREREGLGSPRPVPESTSQSASVCRQDIPRYGTADGVNPYLLTPKSANTTPTIRKGLIRVTYGKKRAIQIPFPGLSTLERCHANELGGDELVCKIPEPTTAAKPLNNPLSEEMEPSKIQYSFSDEDIQLENENRQFLEDESSDMSLTLKEELALVKHRALERSSVRGSKLTVDKNVARSPSTPNVEILSHQERAVNSNIHHIQIVQRRIKPTLRSPNHNTRHSRIKEGHTGEQVEGQRDEHSDDAGQE
jgi:hypothetical protein